MLLTVPCYKCERRHSGCHSHCELYSDFKQKNAELKRKKELDMGKEADAFLRRTHHNM